jgi:hypothetical protein
MIALAHILRLFLQASLAFLLVRGFMPTRKAGATAGGLGTRQIEHPGSSKEGVPPSVEKQHEAKLKKAIALKDYAIENNLFVTDHILDTLGEAEYNEGTRDKAQNAIKLDKAIRDLTKITYPTTMETIQVTDGASESPRVSGEVKYFTGALASILIVSLVVAILFFVDENNERGSALAASLGLMGAIVYILFNIIGIISEKAFNSRDTYINILRTALGPVLGWVLFLGLESTNTLQEDSDAWAVVLLPFLAGFSTRLVVGIITQALRTIELVLGIEGKDTQLLRRQRGGTSGG